MGNMTAEDRRKIKQNLPKTHLSSRHIENCCLVPDRLNMLESFPQNGIAAEIGVAYGEFTREIVQRTKPSHLHLIDTWDSHRYQDGLAAIHAEHDDAIRTGAITIHIGTSIAVLPTFFDHYFDWVYIDTDHTYQTTWAELQLAERKVKPGGLIAGHDFCVGNIITPWPYGVIEACLKFCVDYHWGFKFLTMEVHGHQSFALAKLPK